MLITTQKPSLKKRGHSPQSKPANSADSTSYSTADFSEKLNADRGWSTDEGYWQTTGEDARSLGGTNEMVDDLYAAARVLPGDQKLEASFTTITGSEVRPLTEREVRFDVSNRAHDLADVGLTAMGSFALGVAGAKAVESGLLPAALKNVSPFLYIGALALPVALMGVRAYKRTQPQALAKKVQEKMATKPTARMPVYTTFPGTITSNERSVTFTPKGDDRNFLLYGTPVYGGGSE